MTFTPTNFSEETLTMETSPLLRIESDPPKKPSELDVSKIPSPVLAQLIEEVRNEESGTAHAYNRFHNRHNRSR